MRKHVNDLTYDIVVKVKPCRLTFLMSMVSLDSVKSFQCLWFPWILLSLGIYV
jgi:hypothetical protein